MLATLLMMLAVTAPSRPEVVTVADGVYAIVHPDATRDWPNGNTMVVVGSRGVLVVDSGYLPSVARADIAAIRALTDKPVQFVVNTHWHYDHNNGNAEYRRAFPLAQIIAHRETRRLMDANGARHLAAQASITPELNEQVYQPPTLVFSDEIVVDLGGREVRVAHLGRGNTPGDAIVFVPKERVLATGDLVVAPVPYCYYSYPRDWAVRLRQLRELGAEVIVPGHGAVQHDYSFIDSVAELLNSVIAQVERSPGRTLDEVRARVDLSVFRRRMAGDDRALGHLFDDSIGKALVERAFLAVRGGT